MSTRAAIFWAVVLFVVLSVVASAAVALAARLAKNNKRKATSRLGATVADDKMAPRMNAQAPYSTPSVGVWHE